MPMPAVWREGYDAWASYLGDVDAPECPYKIGTEDHTVWNQGANEAEQDFQDEFGDE